jgi:hypothetical protein
MKQPSQTRPYRAQFGGFCDNPHCICAGEASWAYEEQGLFARLGFPWEISESAEIPLVIKDYRDYKGITELIMEERDGKQNT